MTHLVAAELLKLRTTRAPYWLLGGLLALVGLFLLLGLTLAAVGDVASEDEQRRLLGFAATGSFLPLLLGIMLMAGEYRHGTATQTFLIEPNRERVVAAKAVAAAAAGAVFAVAGLALSFAVGLPWLASREFGLQLDAADIVGIVVGVVLTMALYAALGVGIGAIFRNQVAAIVVTLAWFWIVESILVGFFPSIGRYTPGGAASAIGGEETFGGLLSPLAGGALFAAYTVAFAGVGAVLTRARDVT